MSERPYMPMFWGDYLRDTQHLDTTQHGAYMLLIGSYWCAGKPLPGDDREMARIVRRPLRWWRENRSTLRAFFEILPDGTWSHKRIETELTKWQKRSEAASENAQRRHRKAGAKVTHNVNFFASVEGGENKGDQELSASGGSAKSLLPESKEGKSSSTQSESFYAPNGAANGRSYAFAGEVIRLTGRDYQRWFNAYPDIDLRAELTALDDCYRATLTPDERKHWFYRCSQALANRQERARAAKLNGRGPPARYRRDAADAVDDLMSVGA